ncbi:hypothetical protein D3C84_1142000 [compost metagenome]
MRKLWVDGPAIEQLSSGRVLRVNERAVHPWQYLEECVQVRGAQLDAVVRVEVLVKYVGMHRGS